MISTCLNVLHWADLGGIVGLQYTCSKHAFWGSARARTMTLLHAEGRKDPVHGSNGGKASLLYVLYAFIIWL
jgi:hypothetical protein